MQYGCNGCRIWRPRIGKRKRAPQQQADLIWLVVRHEIDYRGNIVVGDSVTGETYPAHPPRAARRSTGASIFATARARSSLQRTPAGPCSTARRQRLLRIREDVYVSFHGRPPNDPIADIQAIDAAQWFDRSEPIVQGGDGGKPRRSAGAVARCEAVRAVSRVGERRGRHDPDRQCHGQPRLADRAGWRRAGERAPTLLRSNAGRRSANRAAGRCGCRSTIPAARCTRTSAKKRWRHRRPRSISAGFPRMFVPPRALTESEIEAVIQRFVDTAQLAKEAGFDGVQIHAAHGYLASQFLSPLTNQRTDRWGGSPENRARFLLTIVDRVRNAVGPKFGVAVKLNSADFQRGGFAFDGCAAGRRMAEPDGRRLCRTVGRFLRKPCHARFAVQRIPLRRRETYFIDFARDIATVAAMPIMVTGGITKLRDGGRSPGTQGRTGFGVAHAGYRARVGVRSGAAGGMATQGIRCKCQLAGSHLEERRAEGAGHDGRDQGADGIAGKQGKPVQPDISPVRAMLGDQWRTARRAARYRRWREDGRGPERGYAAVRAGVVRVPPKPIMRSWTERFRPPFAWHRTSRRSAWAYRRVKPIGLAVFISAYHHAHAGAWQAVPFSARRAR